jgi:hypothetical protein
MAEFLDEEAVEVPEHDREVERGYRQAWRAVRRIAHRTRLKPVVLLAVALAAGLAALVVFPTEGPVSPQSGVPNLAIYATFIADGVSVQLTDERSPRRTEVLVSVNSPERQSGRESFRLDVPATTWGSPSRCDPDGGTCVLSQGAKIVTHYFGKWTTYRVGPAVWYRDNGVIHLPDLPYNVARNREYVSVSLPAITYYYCPPVRRHVTHSCMREGIPSWIALRIPDAGRYSWMSGGPLPQTGGEYVTWFYGTSPDSTQVVSGVSLPEQDTNNTLLFVAGALLGVAGGALVGAIQEALRD